MKNIIKIVIIVLLWALFISSDLFAWQYSIPWTKEIKDLSIDTTTTWDIATDAENVWLSILETLKIIIQALIMIYIVYVWAQMIMSMWSDEEKLSWAKRQLRYSLFAIIFINIPWSIYTMFNPENKWSLNKDITGSDFVSKNTDFNLFFDTTWFREVLNWDILWFFKIIIFMIAVVMIMIAWFKIMTARWREEKVKEAKQKIIYSVIWLVFLWVIEMWKSFAFDWSIEKWKNLFADLANLSLFFAWPIAIIFITMAWYYYITANWDEEKIKKAKSILINTVLATLILLGSYTFLLDISTLFA